MGATRSKPQSESKGEKKDKHVAETKTAEARPRTLEQSNPGAYNEYLRKVREGPPRTNMVSYGIFHWK